MREDPSGIFATTDVVQLIGEHPLAILVSVDKEDVQVTPLPMLADVASDGRLVSLTGHIARSNPHAALLRRAGRAIVLLHGPNSYVSPSWFQDRVQAPTWHYVTAHLVVDIDILDEPVAIVDALSRMVHHMEDGNENAWHLSEVAGRLEPLLTRIVGVRARVLSASTKLKLGQNERIETHDDTVNALRFGGQHALVKWMVERYIR